MIGNNRKKSDSIIEIDSVDVIYQSTTNQFGTDVFKKLTHDICQNEFFVLVGPSGCGKTTVLKLIAGLIFPSSGNILIDGLSPSKARENRAFGVVFQNPVLFPWRNIEENVRLPGEIFNDEEVKQKVHEVINLVGLDGFEKAYPGELSGGMQSRVAIARSFTFNPKILLMDEPFGDLDELTRYHLNQELLQIWNTRKCTVVFVTHNLTEAVFLADRVAVLSNRPSEIVTEIKIDFPRPRSTSLLYDIEFIKIVQQLKDSLEVDKK